MVKFRFECSKSGTFMITLECIAYFHENCPDDVTLNGFFDVEKFSDKILRFHQPALEHAYELKIRQ